MLFNSFTFIVFFAIVLLIYYLPFPWKGKKLFLLIASYVFYAAWKVPFLLLLWISTLTDWFIAARIHAARGRRKRKMLLVTSLLINLGLLGFFKYSNFFLQSLGSLAHLITPKFSPPLLDVVLPVGISFYTFQTLSYTIDIYRGQARPWPSFLDYALYVSFFPQLVAGPIVRAFHFLPQCIREKGITADDFAWGITLFVLGLFEKVVLADGLLAPIVERIYDAGGTADVLSAWCATLAFSSQIFCDFSGYTLCAIGVGKVLGFSIPDNFRFPYASIGFSDFWRRWHISLSTWFRDYLYIPMGGSRRGQARNIFNLIFTMLIVGLWHGASWRYVIWGGIHGVFIGLERWLKRVAPKGELWAFSGMKFLLALLTFGLVCLTWVFFRAPSMGKALVIIQNMFGIANGPLAVSLGSTDLIIAVLVCWAILMVHWLMRERTLEWLMSRSPWWVTSLVIAGVLISIVLGSGEDRAFIYFQF
ncbi:MAG: MBOAT family protein [Deltaproteobacteria bacterium]|nr:MBOAT family protein [Deltaproteobacteria bacterium]